MSLSSSWCLAFLSISLRRASASAFAFLFSSASAFRPSPSSTSSMLTSERPSATPFAVALPISLPFSSALAALLPIPATKLSPTSLPASKLALKEKPFFTTSLMPPSASDACSFILPNCPVKTSFTILPRPLKASIAVRIGVSRYCSMLLPTPTAPLMMFLKTPLPLPASLPNHSTTLARPSASHSIMPPRKSITGFSASIAFLMALVTVSLFLSSPTILTSSGAMRPMMPSTGFFPTISIVAPSLPACSLTLPRVGGRFLSTPPRPESADA